MPSRIETISVSTLSVQKRAVADRLRAEASGGARCIQVGVSSSAAAIACSFMRRRLSRHENRHLQKRAPSAMNVPKKAPSTTSLYSRQHQPELQTTMSTILPASARTSRMTPRPRVPLHCCAPRPSEHRAGHHVDEAAERRGKRAVDAATTVRPSTHQGAVAYSCHRRTVRSGLLSMRESHSVRPQSKLVELYVAARMRQNAAKICMRRRVHRVRRLQNAASS